MKKLFYPYNSDYKSQYGLNFIVYDQSEIESDGNNEPDMSGFGTGQTPYTEEQMRGFTHREVSNTIPIVWGMNIAHGNDMYVAPIYGSNYGLSMFNDVEKTYPHPYTVAFTYDSRVDEDSDLQCGPKKYTYKD